MVRDKKGCRPKGGSRRRKEPPANGVVVPTCTSRESNAGLIDGNDEFYH